MCLMFYHPFCHVFLYQSISIIKYVSLEKPGYKLKAKYYENINEF